MVFSSGFYILSLFGLIFSILVIVSLNPVYSILFLVLSFLCFSILLLLLGLEFIPILLIIIYIGAISILFLFVIMMLDIKIIQKNKDFKKFSPFLFYLIILFTIFSNENINLITCNLHSFYGYWFNCIDNITNIEFLGIILFSHYYIFILLCGIILLLALIGSVVLTLKFDLNTNYQTTSKQIARDLNLAVFFIK
jgi:NADH-quinone oxidoreductase subunit J